MSSDTFISGSGIRLGCSWRRDREFCDPFQKCWWARANDNTADRHQLLRICCCPVNSTLYSLSFSLSPLLQSRQSLHSSVTVSFLDARDVTSLTIIVVTAPAVGNRNDTSKDSVTESVRSEAEVLGVQKSERERVMRKEKEWEKWREIDRQWNKKREWRISWWRRPPVISFLSLSLDPPLSFTTSALSRLLFLSCPV